MTRQVRFAGIALLGLIGIAAGLYALNWAVGYSISPPPRGVVAEGLIHGDVDYDCIDRSLGKEFAELQHYTAGGGDVPEGVEQTVFDYYRSEDGKAFASFVFTPSPAGIRFEHSFFTHEWRMPREDFPPGFDAMKRAVSIVKGSCGLDLSPFPFRAVGQRVDALPKLS
jgi:hypothetical protein